MAVEGAGYVNVLFAGPDGEIGAAGNLGLFEGAPLATPTEPGMSEATTALAPPTANPMVGRTTLRYRLAAPGEVRLAVYDVLGREVAVLVDGPRAAREHTAVWTPRGLPAGLYVVRLQAGASVSTQRVTVVR